MQSSFQAILENRRDEISTGMRSTVMGLYGERLWVDEQIKAILPEIEETSPSEESSVNVMTISGIGPLISPAIYATDDRPVCKMRGKRKALMDAAHYSPNFAQFAAQEIAALVDL